jgi:hypothetical protein
MDAADEALQKWREALNAPGVARAKEIGHYANVLVGGVDVARVLTGDFSD